MRALRKNESVFYVCKYLGVQQEEIDGVITGELVISYDEPKKYKGNKSPSSGTAQTYMFGSSIDYSNVISPLPANIDINENSLIWVDGLVPNKAKDNYNYIVKKVARSKNFTALAIGKRMVKHED